MSVGGLCRQAGSFGSGEVESVPDEFHEDWAPEIRRQIATHKRFKRMVDLWIDLDVERSKLAMQIAEPGAT